MEVMPMNELYHHGIKGMHWGVRRYQNPDGTYTDAGKRRAAKKERKWASDNASQLSDSELNARINRLQKEKQLKQLTDDVVRPGRKKTMNLLDRYGNQIAATAVGAAATAATTAWVTNKFNDKFNPRKTAYERMKEDLEAKTKLADENMPVNVKGWKREDGEWVPK